MRVVYDYGLGIGGARRQSGVGAFNTASDVEVVRHGKRPVMIIRVGDLARTEALRAGDLPPEEPGTRSHGGVPSQDEDGRRMTIAGTDWLVTVSPEARMHEHAVRLHENAHARALGQYADSGITYQTRRGPDGKSYVIGGSIKADLAEVPGDPRATLRKARTVIAAAQSPGDPSAADMRVAADAYRLARDATAELRELARA